MAVGHDSAQCNYEPMKSPFSRIVISSFAFALWLGGCSGLAPPADRNYPLIDLSEIDVVSHRQFNVRGFVVAVVICPPRDMCISPDGVLLATEPVSSNTHEPEALRKLREQGALTFLMSDGVHRFGLEQGRQYLISYETGRGIVGLSPVE